jgi:Uma2 family endonuclease
MATKALVTIDEYEQLPDTGVRTELVDGEVIELAMGSLLHSFVRDRTVRDLDSSDGGLALAEVEFRTTADRVRRADAVWFAPGRLVEADWNRSILPVPDLVVEVVSPTDRAAEMRQKVHEYLDAGVTTVWVIYLETREADIWNRGRQMTAVNDNLTADCLPGVTIPLDRIFPGKLEPASLPRQ